MERALQRRFTDLLLFDAATQVRKAYESSHGQTRGHKNDTSHGKYVRTRDWKSSYLEEDDSDSI